MRSSPVACGLVVLTATLAAQRVQTPPPPTSPQQTFRAGTQTVMVPASITDEFGEFVRTLTQEDFEIRDNGKVQPITFFDRQIQTVTAILLIDGSASMLTALTPVLAAANDFIVRLLPGDRARIGSFSEDIRLGKAFTSSRDELLATLENEFEIRIGRRTRLWDAMDEAITAFQGVDGRRVLIVLSDGVDTWSIRSYDDVRSRAGRSNVSIYFLKFEGISPEGQRVEFARGRDGSSQGTRKPIPRDAFEALARDTGGGYIPIDHRFVSLTPFTQISLDLHSQYVLGFTPALLDGKEHDLDVRVRQPRLKVRARKSYIASEDGK